MVKLPDNETPAKKRRNGGKIFTVSLFGAATAGFFIAGTVMHSKAKEFDKDASETMSPEAQQHWDDRNDAIKKRNIFWGIAGGSGACTDAAARV